MHYKEWLPRREGELADLQRRWDEWLGNSVKQIAFGWDAGDCGYVMAKIAAFRAARQDYEDVDSSGNLALKNQAQKTSIEAMRDFANDSVRFNRRMGAADKAFLGIRPRAKKVSPLPAPSTQAVITDLRALGGFAVGGRFHDEERPESDAVMRGCNGVFISFAVTAERVASYEALTEGRLVTGSPWRIQRGPEDEGKFFTCAPRWQASRDGALGPWGELQSVVVA